MKSFGFSYLLMLTTSLLMLTSCFGSEGDEPSSADAVALKFSVSQQTAGLSVSSSPAYGEKAFAPKMLRSSSPLESDEKHKTFVVQATKLTALSTRETVMDRYKVSYDDEQEHISSHWYYEGVLPNQYLKYWDLSAQSYDFQAVSPDPIDYPEGERPLITFDPENRNIILQNIYGHSSAPAEWVVAHTKRNNISNASSSHPLLDTDELITEESLRPFEEQPSVSYDEVPLMFHHIMSTVVLRIKAAQPVVIKSIEMTLPSSDTPITTLGDYQIQGAGNGWTLSEADAHKTLEFAHLVYAGDFPVGSDPQTFLTLYEIPQSWAETGRDINVTCKDKDGNIYAGVISLTRQTNGTNSWLPNSRYVYTLKINNDGSSAIILFEVDMETWKWSEGHSIEEEETDW